MTKQIERRIVDGRIECRSNADGTQGVRGYAAVFDSVAHGEVVRRSAFTRTLAQQDDIKFLVNHDGVPLASTRAGTMTVGTDNIGLWFDVPALDVERNPRAAESRIRRPGPQVIVDFGLSRQLCGLADGRRLHCVRDLSHRTVVRRPAAGSCPRPAPLMGSALRSQPHDRANSKSDPAHAPLSGLEQFPEVLQRVERRLLCRRQVPEPDLPGSRQSRQLQDVELFQQTKTEKFHTVFDTQIAFQNLFQTPQ